MHLPTDLTFLTTPFGETKMPEPMTAPTMMATACTRVRFFCSVDALRRPAPSCSSLSSGGAWELMETRLSLGFPLLMLSFTLLIVDALESFLLVYFSATIIVKISFSRPALEFSRSLWRDTNLN